MSEQRQFRQLLTVSRSVTLRTVHYVRVTLEWFKYKTAKPLLYTVYRTRYNGVLLHVYLNVIFCESLSSLPPPSSSSSSCLLLVLDIVSTQL